MKNLKVRLTFLEEVLGTASGNQDIHKEFIASKSPDAASIEEEVAAIGVDAEIEKSKTIFPKKPDGTPIFWDYQIKGFFKDSCGALKRCTGYKSKDLKAYKKEIDGTVFVNPRQIEIKSPSGQVDIGDCQRPLRGQTAQGERIALANSETIPAGCYIDIEIVLLNESLEAVVKEWLDYGQLRGLGQWRNSGKGRFTWEEIG